MKRIRLAALLVSLVLLFGCLPTPTEDAVKQQREDYIDRVQVVEEDPTDPAPTGTTPNDAQQPTSAPEITEQQVSEQVTQVEIPETIRTEPVSLTDNLLMQYDCTVKTPKDRFAIAQAELRIFTENELSDYINRLLPEGPRFCELAKTKAYWTFAAQSYIEACRKAGREPEEETIEHISAKAKAAPESAEEKPFNLRDAKEHQWYHAYAQNADGSYAKCSVKLGSAWFYYVKCEDVAYLREDVLHPDEDRELLKDYRAAFPDPDALLPHAEAVLEQFGLSDMMLFDAIKIIAYKGSIPYEYGWDFTFVHGVDGIPQRFAFEETITNELFPPTLVSPFGAECALISINGDGELMCADLQNILQTPEIVLDNVRLCEIADLQSSIVAFIKSSYSWPASNINEPGSCVIVDSMDLCMAEVVVKDHLNLGRLIPAWYVTGRYVGTTKNGNRFEDPFGHYFSALDGAYIEPRITRTMGG